MALEANPGSNTLEEFIKNNAVSYEEVLKELSKIPLCGNRDYYINLLVKERKEEKANIEKDLRRIQDESSQKETVEKKEEMSAEAKGEALALLNEPELLEKFLDACEELGCVGEDENKIAIYLTLTSRKLNDPINLIVKGESSAGKSFLVQSIEKFFPKEELLEFTAMTPKALYHRKDSLKHKALIIHEHSGAEESDYSIRVLQSEKKLVFSQVQKNTSTSHHETVDKKIEGPIAYIETTTKTHIHPENETR
ncbi:MAG: hypothetical protein ACW99Q_26700, partial [Candidatus Kariarchaeaceae archaeon]